ncbi:MAG TPA: type II toxin-antitoxin system VapC family toxin [Verrucomicrobiales bacterium]|nr:type II toxin-antitoxin system VapC family toxin [Verrucomicrobiales bacterium]
MKYLLDTHTWIWWHMKPNRLSKKVRSLISNKKAYEELLISAISPWEFCKLIEKGRLGIIGNPKEWLSAAFTMPKLRLVPLTPGIAYQSTILPPPFHNDPADQIIVATAQDQGATILTKDRLMLDYREASTLW